jgi:hypothetical protein
MKEFMEGVKNLEEYIQSSGIFKGEKISKKVKNSFAGTKPKSFLMNLIPNLIFMKRKEKMHG